MLKAATQKPSEWANSLLVRFEEQVCEKKHFSYGVPKKVIFGAEKK